MRLMHHCLREMSRAREREVFSAITKLDSFAPYSVQSRTLVSIVGPSEARPVDGLAIDFVVESDRAQLGEIVQRVRDGRLRTNIGTVSTLDDAVAAFNPTERRKGKTIIRIRP